MNILNKLTMKHLKLNKRRTIVSIIGIVLSTAMMVGVGLLMSSTRESMIQEVEQSSGSHHVVIKNVKVEKKTIIENNKNIENYCYYEELGYAKYEESTNQAKPYFYLIGGSNNYLKTLTLKEGRLPNQEDEIVLSNHIFNQGDFPYQIGDEITLEIGDRMIEDDQQNLDNPYQEEETLQAKREKTYKIVGIVERSYYEPYSSPGFFIYTKGSQEESNKINVILTYKNPKDSIKLTEILLKNIGKTSEEEAKDVEYNDNLLSMYGASKYDNFNNFLEGFLVLFLSIISIACVIVIYNSFAISVMERKKQFGLLSSIGATKRQIRKTVFYEATIVGLTGIILGVLGAYLGIGIVTMILNQLLKEMLPGGFALTTYPAFVFIPLIFIIIVIYISAFLPARRASKISPIEVIRQNDDIKINKRKIKTSRITRKLFGVEGEIALKNTKRNKKKYRITIISLFISIVTFIAFFTYLDYGKKTLTNFVGTFHFDVVATNYQNTEEGQKAIQALTQQEDVDDFLKISTLDQTSEISSSHLTKEYRKYRQIGSHTEVQTNINVIKLGEEQYQKYKKEIGLTKDQPILYNYLTSIDYSNNGRKIVSIKVYQEKKNLKIDFIDFQEEKEQIVSSLDHFYYTNKLPKMLENVFDSPIIIVSDTLYQELLEKKASSGQEIQMVYIKADHTKQLDLLGEKYQSSNSIIYNNITTSMQLQNNLLLALEILFYGLLTLITLIGVTSVFNTITTSINLRRKEFAVLRSIGLSPKGFNKMIRFESLIFGFKSLIYGLPVGCLLSYLISKNMNMLVEDGFYLPGKAIFICILAVFIIVMITMKYSTSKIKKENIIETIRNENI